MVQAIATVIALVFSTLTWVWAVRQQKKNDERKMVYDLLNNWTVERMQESRKRAWKYLDAKWNSVKAGSSKAFVGADRVAVLDSTEHKNYYALAEVDHFLADLNTMLEQKLVDEKLVLCLFGRAMSAYLKRLDTLDFRINAEDADPENIGVNQWYTDKVAPLKGHFRRIVQEQKISPTSGLYKDVEWCL